MISCCRFSYLNGLTRALRENYGSAMQTTVMSGRTLPPAVAPVRTGEKYIIASVQRATQVLAAFLEPPHEFGVSELGRRLGQTKNQTFRLLQTLADEGMVVMDPTTKKYSLGYRMLELGIAAQQSSPIVSAAAPVMDRLAMEIGETVNLGVMADDRSAICVDQRESRWALQIRARIGARFPLYAGAISKLLLANQSDAFIECFLDRVGELPRFTDNTITDRDEFVRSLEQIRREGISASDEDLDLGACSYAAPIRNRHGNVIAGISIAAPISRLSPESRQRNIVAVRGAAEEISCRLLN